MTKKDMIQKMKKIKADCEICGGWAEECSKCCVKAEYDRLEEAKNVRKN